MATKNKDEIMRCGAEIQVAPAGTGINGVFTPIGYASKPVKASVKQETIDLTVEQHDGPILKQRRTLGMTIEGSTVQVGAEQMAIALGKANANTLTMGGSSPEATRTFAVKVIGLSLLSGQAVVYYMPNAISEAEVSVEMGRSAFVELPLSFSGCDGDSGIGQIVYGSGNVTKTIATGAFARDAAVNFYLVAGEGAAADSLDTISGTFAANEEVVLMISSASQPITVTHTATGTGKINLDGAVPWLMDKVGDWLRLRSDGTKFVEVARYNA